jgi:hypothetical protein
MQGLYSVSIQDFAIRFAESKFPQRRGVPTALGIFLESLPSTSVLGNFFWGSA